MKLVFCVTKKQHKYTFIKSLQVNEVRRIQTDSKLQVRFFTYR